jgi:hypothetical protein
MPLTFKLSFELFDFNDEDFLNDLKHVSLSYDNFVVLEYKENKQKYQKNSDHLMTQKKTLTNVIFNLVI